MSALLALSLLALAAQPPAEAPAERERTLAEGAIGEWELAAWMTIDHSGPHPEIEEIICEMERDGLELRTGIVGGLRINLEGGEAFRTRDVRALGLGGTVWEFRFRDREPADWQFADVAYPTPPPPAQCDFVHGACRIIDNGSPLVRRSPGEPWLHVDTLANELLRASGLRVGVQDRNSDDPAALRWIDVPLGDLPELLAWCAREMRSDGARRYRRP